MAADRKKRGIIEEEDDVKSEILAASSMAVSNKSKGRHGFKFFLLLILLAAGIVTGMHIGGFINVRPYLWGTVPSIPFVGDYLKEHLNIPEVYTMTVAERRKLELQQWQERLEIKERELQAMIAQSITLSNDISFRQQKMEKMEADLLEKEKNRNMASREATLEEKELIKELTDTYKDISPRKAAQIIAQLPDSLAVELMKKLPQDARASILAKMEPKRAARITESIANPQ